MNSTSEVLATNADRSSGGSPNYGTFGAASPLVRRSTPSSPSKSFPERDYDDKSEEEDSSSSSGEDESVVRTYKVSGGPYIASQPRAECVVLNRPPPSSPPPTAADPPGGPFIQLASLSTLPLTGSPRRENVVADRDENGNGIVDEEEGRTGSQRSGDGVPPAANNPSASLLVTTTVSFDENHKRNSVHLFVADVNDNEHINEVEETTRI